jgi:hypothetical protein
MNLFKRLVIALEKIADKKDDYKMLSSELKEVMLFNIRLQEKMMGRLKIADMQRRYFYLKEKNQETLTEDEKTEIYVWETNYKDKVEEAGI